MSFMTSFDTAMIVIDEASKRFGSEWKINEESLSFFKEYCDALDDILSEFNGDGIDVEVDEDTKTITVGVNCEYLIVESPDHVLCKLLQRAVLWEFSQPDDDLVSTKFMFPSVWDRA